MVILPTLAVVLAGCGVNPQSALHSRTFRRLVRRFEAGAAGLPRRSLLRKLHHCGPLAAGRWLLSGIDTPPPQTATRWKQDACILAGVELAGQKLLAAAKHCLPATLVPGSRFRLPTLPADASLLTRDLARSWRSADAAIRKAIIRLLVQTLYPKGPHAADDDLRKQPNRRVLPAMFGPWQPDANDPIPNCLGKALLAGAFGRLAGAEMLVVATIRSSADFERRARTAVAAAVLRDMDQAGVPLTSARREGLQAIIVDGLNERLNLIAPHYAVAFRVGPGEWMVGDPNFGQAFELDASLELDAKVAFLRESRRAAPGLTLLLAQPGRNIALLRLEQSRRFHPELSRLTSVLGTAPGRERIITEVERSPLLDAALEWREFGPGELAPDCSRRRKAVCVLLEMLLDLAKADGSERRERCLWFVHNDWTAEELAANLTDQSAAAALQHLIYKLYVRPLQAVEEDFAAALREGREIPYQCQLSLPHPGFAVPTLAHVAVNSGIETSDAVERELLRHYFDIHRIICAAGRVCRRKQDCGTLDHMAVALLSELPVRPASAELLLEALNGRLGAAHCHSLSSGGRS